ncbi:MULTISPECIES: enoyl-CoA hydratase/isomerase family protein [Nocardia]|uniref:enoyl-CoA hydratase/isomerase family protein n=1 Tax=Nocardia TaxID=1817 RepID=UPI0007EB9BE9|nr:MULTISPECIES: enoyl-CoA hydratase-related protein [Nocardia]MBF6278394.1 enoyl-CoA hydratase/isomerase family protein [Nocardia nova]OBA47863.1 2,3-dehydroadipyl-CoA hydratase [Nocardia sp. 852002-51101_SCH5132738]OBB30238.1 2,3-dehydroadipyl-CoA hydratase [Nocardia sp. 852002-51244_SCH5132740]OBF68020.1 2,3-dehydroadipyl-CoA hydratase [Mycobacterium sp. 852002-51759_SCH5129042]
MTVLQTSRHGAVAILELCRPAAQNSLNEELLAALNLELAHLRGDDTVRAVVLTGTGGLFCAGADITAFDSLRAQPLLGDRPALGGTIWADLGTYPKPVIAAVEGLALGGGCELALACDIVIAGSSAQFGVPEVKLGVIPGGGGTQRLIRAIGKSKAMVMLLTGDFVSAQWAADAGLVAEVVADGEAVAHATAVAHRISRNSPMAVALAKDAALRAFETTLSQGLEHEKRNFESAIRSADSYEGQAAFLAKRTPEFTGK